MPEEELMLVAVDDSEAATRAVRYAGRVLGGCRGCRIVLLHVLPSMPTGLLEHGGNLGREELREYEEARARWVAEKEKEEEPHFESLRRMLGDAGVGQGSIETACFAPKPEETIPGAILEAAHRRRAGTVILGRNMLPWYWEKFRRHVSDDLMRRASGLAVWVVQ